MLSHQHINIRRPSLGQRIGSSLITLQEQKNYNEQGQRYQQRRRPQRRNSMVKPKTSSMASLLDDHNKGSMTKMTSSPALSLLQSDPAKLKRSRRIRPQRRNSMVKPITNSMELWLDDRKGSNHKSSMSKITSSPALSQQPDLTTKRPRRTRPQRRNSMVKPKVDSMGSLLDDYKGSMNKITSSPALSQQPDPTMKRSRRIRKKSKATQADNVEYSKGQASPQKSLGSRGSFGSIGSAGSLSRLVSFGRLCKNKKQVPREIGDCRNATFNLKADNNNSRSTSKQNISNPFHRSPSKQNISNPFHRSLMSFGRLSKIKKQEQREIGDSKNATFNLNVDNNSRSPLKKTTPNPFHRMTMSLRRSSMTNMIKEEEQDERYGRRSAEFNLELKKEAQKRRQRGSSIRKPDKGNDSNSSGFTATMDTSYSNSSDINKVVPDEADKDDSEAMDWSDASDRKVMRLLLRELNANATEQ